MAKSSKRIAAGALAVMTALSLTACNTDDNSSSGAGNSNESSTNSANNSSSSADNNSSTSSDNGGSSTPTPPTGGQSDWEADYSEFIPENTVTLDVYSQLSNYSGKQLGWFADIMKEKFNVELNIINNPDGMFATRMESGNLGDIVVFGSMGDYAQAATAGLLLDWEDEDILQDFGPYINEFLQPALDKAKNASGSDGKVHGYGHDVATDPTKTKMQDYWPALRYDLYEQIGKPEIKTLDDYIEVFKQMKEICPTSDSGKETYAVSLFSDWDGDMVMFVKTIGALYGFDEFGLGLYDCEKNVYQDVLADDGWYLKALKWYNKLYQEGLLNPNSMTQSYDDVATQLVDGATFFNQFKWMGADLYNTPEHVAEGKIMACVPPADSKNLVEGLNIYGGERVWTIGAKTQYPELCMAIINWFSTPEGTMTIKYGPQGTTWDYNSDGKAYLTDDGLRAMTDKKGVTINGSTFEDGEFKINNTTMSLDDINPLTGERYNWEYWSTTAKEYNDIQKSWQAWSGFETADDYLESRSVVNVKSTYTGTQKDAELDATWNQVKDCVKTGSWNAIFAKDDAEFDSIVAKMKSDAEAYGYAQCVEFQTNEGKLRAAAVQEALAAAQ
ncbi:MAG: hypothetical protein NC299_08670 [Lachnospiraceae bacterium]|nr:hypothetical protein [Ruminococcus sp.]MCM1275426.1 hypothetical protein [Lachnospiraceae bacterium]